MHVCILYSVTISILYPSGLLHVGEGDWILRW